MSRTKMTSDEFNKGLRRNHLTPTKACDLVFVRTEATIHPKHLHKAFSDYGTLSEPLTATFRLLFLMLDEIGKKDERV